jgi:hypothetical protein
VYDRLTFAQRFELHVHIAEWYERRGEERLNRLAYHWSEVVDCMKDPSEELILKAIKYLRLTGEKSLRNSPAEAWNWLNKAKVTTTKLPDSKGAAIRDEIDPLIEQSFPIREHRPNFDASALNLRNLSGVSGSVIFEVNNNM